jgi:hypothetical protein
MIAATAITPRPDYPWTDRISLMHRLGLLSIMSRAKGFWAVRAEKRLESRRPRVSLRGSAAGFCASERTMKSSESADNLDAPAGMRRGGTGRQIIVLALLMLSPPLLFSILLALVAKPPSLPVVADNQWVLFTDLPLGIEPEMSLSPDGQSLLYGCWEWETDASNVMAISTYPVLATLLLDLETGDEVKLPFPKPRNFNYTATSGGVHENLSSPAFTPDGKCIHVMDPPEGGPSSKVLLYDIGSRASREIEVGPCHSFVSDEGGKYLLVNPKEFSSKVRVVPISGGAAEEFLTQGSVCGASRKGRAILCGLSFEGSEQLSIVDLVHGKTLKSLCLRDALSSNHPAPFYVADERFLCYNQSRSTHDWLAVIRDRLFLLTGLGTLSFTINGHWPEASSACFWDSVEDRVFTLGNAVVLGPGPSWGTVLIVDGEMKNLRMLDLANGRTFVLEAHAGDAVVCARGKHVLFETKGPKGTLRYVLTEIGVPGQTN